MIGVVGTVLSLSLGVGVSLGGGQLLAGYAVYQIVCVRRWGRTAGKSLLELEVVRADTGERPSLVLAARRGLALVAIPFAVTAAKQALEGTDRDHAATGVMFVVFLFWIVHLAIASARSHGKRTLWDRLSGTLVRYRAAPRSR